ncbi:CDP-diacylglycerol--glycerol-3-phosphate 3-phosphatidyltransferase, partial [Proteus columbae]|nr:CDP-diacylglycerol--glycerol-3-phosphate 3-phosphatidyltransferase [Proteus columbae]
IENLSIALMYIAAILTFWSMFQYLKAAWADLSEA